MTRRIHLVGSVNLADTEEVFETTSELLGDAAPRLPDGETGERRIWTEWQHRRLLEHPAFEPAPPLSYGRYEGLERVRLRPPGPERASIEFQPPGYADAALASYAVFARLKGAGRIPAQTRMMVALPTPLAVLEYVVVEDTLEVEPHYERALLGDLARICAEIPHDQLAIQWDVCHEMVVLEELIDAPFEDRNGELATRLARLTDAVPADVQVGWHFCYGSWHEEHFVEPKDAGLMVGLANAALAQVGRDVDFLHFPVPIGRDDDAYFEAFERLSERHRGEIFLGIVHRDDGVEGAQRRAATASRHLDAFGVAAECGLGRASREATRPWLEAHAEVAGGV